MRCLPSLISLACLALPCAAQAGTGPPAAIAKVGHEPPTTDRLLVCNKIEHTLSIFSPAERRELAVVPTGRGPHEVAVSPDGRTAVVTDYGDQKPGHSLTIVDITTAKVVRTVDLGQPTAAGETANKKYLRPHGVQFVGEHRVLVTSEASRRLLLVDIERGQVLRMWPTHNRRCTWWR